MVEIKLKFNISASKEERNYQIKKEIGFSLNINQSIWTTMLSIATYSMLVSGITFCIIFQ